LGQPLVAHGVGGQELMTRGVTNLVIN
jgi:hypothetical protein